MLLGVFKKPNFKKIYLIRLRKNYYKNYFDFDFILVIDNFFFIIHIKK